VEAKSCPIVGSASATIFASRMTMKNPRLTATSGTARRQVRSSDRAESCAPASGRIGIYHGCAARHMVPTAHLLTFAVAACALIVVPGPSVLFVIGRAVALGRRAGLATVVGNAAGEYLQLVLVAIGVGALIERSAVVFTVLKLVGAGYVVFLGVRAIRCRRELAGVLDGTVVPEGDRRILREGFVVGATNPKTAAFFGAVLPQFVEPAAGNVALQLLALGVIWVAIALVSDGAWAYLAGAARHWLARSPRRLELVGGAEGS
jgi:threonine/homoserine/homoserine lactone efflux protein